MLALWLKHAHTRAWGDFLGTFVLRGFYVAFMRGVACCRKCNGILPVHVGNAIERYELLTILCIGEQVWIC